MKRALLVLLVGFTLGPAASWAAPGAAPVDSLEIKGDAKLARGDLAAADSLFHLALARRAAEPGPSGAGRTRALLGLAEVRRLQRKAAAADSLLDLAAAAPSVPLLEARLHEIRGNLRAEQGRVDVAIPEFDRALALAAQASPVDSLVLARMRTARARGLIVAGRHAEARADLELAIAIQERKLGPNDPALGFTLFIAAQAASQVGDYAVGVRDAERAVAIGRGAFGPSHPFVAAALTALGSARRNLGDLAGALEAMERAEAIQRAAPAPNPIALASTLGNEGAVLLLLGDGARARKCFEETIVLRGRVYGAERAEDLYLATGIANALLLEGDAAGARARVERALAQAPAIDPLNTPSALTTLAWAARRLGDAMMARAALERAHALSDSLRGPDSPHTLELLGELAALDLEQGRRASAYARAVEIEEHSRPLLAQAADVLSEREALEWEGVRESGRAVLVTLAADSIGLDPEPCRIALDAVIRARMLVLDRRAAERAALPTGDPAVAALVRELEAARTDLARLLVDAARTDRGDSAAIAEARVRREAAERALGAASASYRGALAGVEGGIDAVASGLGRRWALVSYARVPEPRVEGGDVSPSRPDSARYVAFVLRAGERVPRVIQLGTASRVEPAIERWLGALAVRPPGGLAAASERRAGALGRAVERALWDPLSAALAGSDTIAWVPDGALHRIDLAALPGPAAGRYLADGGPLLARLTAERDLVPGPAGGAAGRGLLALGAVDFDASTGADAAVAALEPDDLRAGSRLRFPPLPATAAEIDAIVRAWTAANPGDGPVLAYRGPDALEERVKREAPGRRVLHLATHGFALAAPDTAAAPLADAGLRGVGGVASADGGEAAANSRRAPATPGLALAGANRPAAPGADDGFLTAEEISALDLRGVEWTVLSACASGVADPGAVEAVQGLHRAFRRAGAATVIGSLWPVDDAATADWMGALYSARFERGLSTPAAVRAAQRAVLAARRKAGTSTHPFYWAAFFASGRAR